jgi:predicted negative regulator of RcsB-dependent stress response
MEQDTPPSAGFYHFLGWLENNKQRVAIGALVLLAVGTVIGFLVWRSHQKQIHAEQALSAVRMPFGPSQLPEPGTAEALLKVAADYPDTLAAAKATLRAGTVYFDQGNYPKAQEQFEKYLRAHGETPWVPQAVYGIAASIEAQGKTAEAITKYTNFLATYPSDPAADQARLTLARLYEQTQQPALALDVLNKLVSNQAGGFSPSASEAQDKIRELYAKHPALAPSNPPPFAPSPNMLTNFVRPTNMAQLTNAVRQTNTLLKITNVPSATAPNPAPINVTP